METKSLRDKCREQISLQIQSQHPMGCLSIWWCLLLCQIHRHAMNRISPESGVIPSGSGLRITGLLMLAWLGSLIDTLEPFASRARSDPSRQLKPKTLRLLDRNPVTRQLQHVLLISLLRFLAVSNHQASMAIDILHCIHPKV